MARPSSPLTASEPIRGDLYTELFRYNYEIYQLEKIPFWNSSLLPVENRTRVTQFCITDSRKYRTIPGVTQILVFMIEILSNRQGLYHKPIGEQRRRLAQRGGGLHYLVARNPEPVYLIHKSTPNLASSARPLIRQFAWSVTCTPHCNMVIPCLHFVGDAHISTHRISCYMHFTAGPCASVYGSFWD
jgi:hypothetical protein